MYRDTIARYAEAGAHKAGMVRAHLMAFLIGSALAGAYIGFGDIFMFTVGAHADPSWSHLAMGAVFASALTIVVFAGSELFTGTAMYMPFAVLRGDSGVGDMLRVWIACWVGNLVGAVVLAALLHMAGGGVLLTDGSSEFFAVVAAKIAAPGYELFARGLLCNWLVCLAIWMCGRTENDAAKIALIFWPIAIFVACGFEHSVANMFVFALALLGEHPETITLEGAAHNLAWVTLGNLAGGGLMVGLGYWLQERGVDRQAEAAIPAPAARPSNALPRI
ncbi:formate/nitrite transporter family protein [Inquilinus limosus]|uniref:Nitrite transporter NirC n=1 Tax=Inquilinus limosus TaxID=171674 RepID=A0A211ZUT4_9PROT|nr:formate/nitrite transporter family protein [Inquilinus limosus]OWJ68974.1 nitrite transporter NirC [Inquilinus limosus]